MIHLLPVPTTTCPVCFNRWLISYRLVILLWLINPLVEELSWCGLKGLKLLVYIIIWSTKKSWRSCGGKCIGYLMLDLSVFPLFAICLYKLNLSFLDLKTDMIKKSFCMDCWRYQLHGEDAIWACWCHCDQQPFPPAAAYAWDKNWVHGRWFCLTIGFLILSAHYHHCRFGTITAGLVTKRVRIFFI